MKQIYEIVKIALSNLFNRPLRSFLTALTAAIGIATVVATVSILDGAKRVFRDNVNRLGADVIAVHNARSKVVGKLSRIPFMKKTLRKIPDIDRLSDWQPLTISDGKFLEKKFGQDRIISSPAIVERRSITTEKNITYSTTVIGTIENFNKMFSLNMLKGRFLNKEDILRKRQVCVLDDALAKKIFDDENPIGREIGVSYDLRKIRFTIIGVLADPFSMMKSLRQIDTGFMARNVFYSRLEFKNVYLPIPFAKDKDNDVINTLLIKAKNENDVEPLMEKLETYFVSNNKNVYLQAQKPWILETLQSADDFTTFCNVIWIIILAIAAVMIMIVTLLSVRRRFQEIAIRITEGATKGKIVLQFGMENFILFTAGGSCGIFLGIVFTRIIERIIISWKAVFSTYSILLAVILTVLVGILTSIPPARRAASLNPVEVFRMR